MKAWGLVKSELAKKANDGRIRPEAIKDGWGRKMAIGRCYGVGAMENPRGPIGHKRYDMTNWPPTWLQVGFPQPSRRRVKLVVVKSSKLAHGNHIYNGNDSGNTNKGS
ncbi:hypothetical protein O181_116842 [Austropuccinia psidii MF-1]|uniref:Uncharacterized protein n=1 Tax=Austropuccinia psidii MF-1 TaxID=1389203 RepID=A0A9Q3KC85_9BASI|nr:hypothetical protein [Austropuccinia psidii MF-1]